MFQDQVRLWTFECFGDNIALDKVERNHRFLEESLELVQSAGCTRDECLKLVDYVYNRPSGEIKQETGGVMVTLAAFCNANNINMEECGNTEIDRVWKKIDIIRKKQMNKPKNSCLPGEP
jgi:NTP pyrophosphatase (non-canonical NTP hydrolase)